MKQTNKIILACFVCFFQISAQSDPSTPPRIGIEEVRYDSFPDIRMNVFIFDMLKDETALYEQLTLFQNEEPIPLVEAPELMPISSNVLDVSVLVDSRIPYLARTSIMQKTPVLFSHLSDSLSWNIVEEENLAEFNFEKQIEDGYGEHFRLYLLILNDCQLYVSTLYELFSQATYQNVYFGLFHLQPDNVCNIFFNSVTNGRTSNLLFTKQLLVHQLNYDLFFAVGAFQRSRYLLRFRMPDVKHFENEYIYQVDYSSRDRADTVTALITHHYPNYLVHEAYLNHVLSACDILKADRDFIKAHAILKEAYRNLQIDTINLVAEELIRKESNLLLANDKPNPDSLFSIAEKTWGYDVDTNEWYREIKTNLLKHVYDQYNDKLSIDERLSLLNDIYQYDPTDTRFRNYYYHTLGDSYKDANDYANAVNEYLKVFDASTPCSNLHHSLKQVLTLFFEERYQERDFKNIYNTGNRASLIIKDDFRLNYYFGQSSIEMQDFPRAYDAYKFLYFNWTNDYAFIDWNDLLLYIEELAMKARDFEQALYMNIRLQRSIGGRGQIRNYLMNLRTADYYWVSKQLAVFYQRNGYRHDLSRFDNSYPGRVHPAINAIYVLDARANHLHTSYVQNEIRIPGKIKQLENRREVLLREKDDIDLYTYLIHSFDDDGRKLVVELKNSSFEDTQALLRDVEYRYTIAKPWNNLRRIEREYNQKRSAVAFAAIQELELERWSELNLSAYWQEGSDKVEYMVLHKPDGEICQAYGFEESKAQYVDEEWERSALTRAYFEQIITYNGQPVRDIALPIYLANEFYGVIRIGFLK